ncbi:hypothetical protein [Demequina globuliformis]|uniref:hypothetical protein n=1 Tax=Demequina globuliformis TaxID=676202 RepID=UPI000785DDAC|nr:hypothetical protein [Demequina globuliformis]
MVTAPLAFNVRAEPALYEVRSLQSSSVYWCDARTSTPRYLRLAGGDSTPLRLDASWHKLLWLQAEEVAWDADGWIPGDEIDYFDVQPWTLRAGSQHMLLSPDRTPGRLPIYWLHASPCRELIQHTSVPAWLEDLLGAFDGAPLGVRP